MQIIDFDVELINSHFTLPINLNLNDVVRLMNEQHPDRYATYNPEHHKCVDVYFLCADHTTVRIFIFHSGSVLLAGKILNPDNLVLAFMFITQFVVRNADLIRRKFIAAP